jgi:hypothetical protein
MAIEIVNSTNAPGLEFTVFGYTNGSATPIASGNLAPMDQPNSSIMVPVSGYETYGVSFYPVGWSASTNATSFCSTPEITDKTIVQLSIDVEAN